MKWTATVIPFYDSFYLCNITQQDKAGDITKREINTDIFSRERVIPPWAKSRYFITKL